MNNIKELSEALRKEKAQPVFFVDGGEEFQIETVLFDSDPKFLLFKSDGTREILTKFQFNNQLFIPYKKNDPLLLRIPPFTEVVNYESETKLLNDIRSFIRKWVDLEERYEKLLAFYVLFTYIYDAFEEVPYVHILADLGSGKTRLGVKVLGSICFRSFSTIGVSSIPALFRLLSTIRGTLILDEADIKKSEKTDEIIQMLNSGYIKNLPVIRAEQNGKNKNFSIVSYDVFGPKIFLSRESTKDDALESRCLPIRLTSTKRKDIPLLLSSSLNVEAQTLRNKLLSFRIRNRFTARTNVDYSLTDLDVAARTKQLLLCISAVVRDEKSKQLLCDFANELTKKNSELRGESFSGEILDSIHFLTENPLKKEYRISLTEIADKMNESRDPHKKVHARGIGKKIREVLQLNTVKSHGIITLVATLEELNECFEKYDLELLNIPEEAKIFFN